MPGEGERIDRAPQRRLDLRVAALHFEELRRPLDELRRRDEHVPRVARVAQRLQDPRFETAAAQSRAIPIAAAIRSAVLNPTPHTSFARRYGSRDTTFDELARTA